MILLGLSRSGKTSVGRILAERLRLPFYDTDELIRIRTGLTPRELCRQAGVSALHTAEAAALRECCALYAPCGAAPAAGLSLLPLPDLPQLSMTELSLRSVVFAEKRQSSATANGAVIAAGGGICDNAEAFALVAAIPHRIFLYAPEAALFERLTSDATQTGYYPAFLHFLPVAQKMEAERLFSELYVRRTERYRRSCTLIIDTTGLTCAAVAEEIAAIC